MPTSTGGAGGVAADEAEQRTARARRGRGEGRALGGCAWAGQAVRIWEQALGPHRGSSQIPPDLEKPLQMRPEKATAATCHSEGTDRDVSPATGRRARRALQCRAGAGPQAQTAPCCSPLNARRDAIACEEPGAAGAWRRRAGARASYVSELFYSARPLSVPRRDVFASYLFTELAVSCPMWPPRHNACCRAGPLPVRPGCRLHHQRGRQASAQAHSAGQSGAHSVLSHARGLRCGRAGLLRAAAARRAGTTATTRTDDGRAARREHMELTPLRRCAPRFSRPRRRRAPQACG